MDVSEKDSSTIQVQTQADSEMPDCDVMHMHCTRANLPHVLDLTDEIAQISQYAVAHGGFSDIYRGQWSPPGAPDRSAGRGHVEVAIKVLRVFTSQQWDGAKALKRFSREANVWRLLNHPNIAKFYGVSYQMAGRPSLVMRWYSNKTVPHYLKSRPDAKRRMIVDVAEGLKYLHTLNPGIVHGDLKGNNVLVDDNGRGVITDFGLARVIQDLIPSGTSTLAGSVRWQAPQLVFISEDSDDGELLPAYPTTASDVWSFGCTALELLTGNVPYAHYHNDWFVVYDLMQGISPLRSSDEAVHQVYPLRDLLTRCWAFHPKDRPTMEIVLCELKDILHHHSL